ncbi:MAG: hypothetical protein V1888_03535 [archaeon]
MAIEEVVGNFTDIVSVLPPEIAERIGGLIIILQAASVAFVIYVVYLIVNFILNIKRYRKLKVLEGKVDLISKKLDRVLKKRG